MPKKIYVEHLGHEDGPQVRVKKIIREFDDECCGGEHGHKNHRKEAKNDECCGEHKHQERKHHEFREFKEHKGNRKNKYNKKRHVHVRPRFEKKMKTKMFTTKESLVEYVNEIGELGHAIDVFKISEDLFKVVVVERVEVKQDIKVEVKETPEQEIEVEVEIEEE